jgi:cyclophilin family peptidyl-prolyl cis-trans isomerase
MKFFSLLFMTLGVSIFLGAGCAENGEEETAETEEVSAPPTEPETPASPSDGKDDPVDFPGVLPSEELTGRAARIVTDRGEIVVDLYGETAPLAVSNFIHLAESGFYNGLTFHRREEGFVIQGGDPEGDGTGGPGYTFPDELQDELRYERGVVAMANRGSDTNGSQFFLMLEEYPLEKHYTIFGRVREGLSVMDAIAVGDVMRAVMIE